MIDTLERYTDGPIFTMRIQETVQTLSVAKAPKKNGKGSATHKPYVSAGRDEDGSRKALVSHSVYKTSPTEQEIRIFETVRKYREKSDVKRKWKSANDCLTQTIFRYKLIVLIV